MGLVFNPFTGTLDFTGGSGGGGGTTPALPFTSVQFNNSGAFGGSANLTWDGTTLDAVGNVLGSQVYGGGALPPAGHPILTYPLNVSVVSDGFNGIGILTSGGNGCEIDAFNSRGTNASPQDVQVGDSLFSINGIGYCAGWGGTATEIQSEVYDVTNNVVAGTFEIDLPTIGGGGRTAYYRGIPNGYTSIGPRAQGDLTNVDATLTIEDSALLHVTTHVIRAGSSQATTDLTQWQSAAKVVLAKVSATGVITGVDFAGGTWQGKTLTLGGTLITSGAFASTFTMTGATGVTFPTSGTLLTTAGSGTSLTFPGTLSIASGKVFTASNTLTLTGTDSTSFAFPGSSDTVVTLAATQTLTNKRITKRVTTASDATSITPNSDSADVTYQLNTQAAGTLTINADGGSPTNGQSWLLKIKSTNAQTFAWNSIYVGGAVALPTATSGGSKIDNFSFLYDSVTPKWEFTGSAVGF